MRSRAPAQRAKTEDSDPAQRPQAQINRGGHRVRARPASLAGMYPSAKHSRVKSSTTVRIRNRRPSASVSDRKSRLQRRLGPCNQISFSRDQQSALCVTSLRPLCRLGPTRSISSDRPDLREPARRLRRAPIKRASEESIEYLRTELSSLSQPYCLKKFSNKEKAVSLPKIA